MRTPLVVASCLVLALGTAAGQQSTYRASVDLVVVDAHVVDAAAKPVTDLRPSDFNLSVDGKPRPIVTAQYVSERLSPLREGGPFQPRPEVSTNAVDGPMESSRTILLVVDAINIRTSGGRSGFEGAGRFLDSLLPTDRVGLAVIPDASLGVEPTTDLALIRRTLAGMTGRLVPVQSGVIHIGLQDAFALEGDWRRWQDAVERECHFRPQRPGDSPNPCNAEMEALARTIVADARRRVLRTLDALRVYMNALSRIEGPKSLILITEELPVSVFAGQMKEFQEEATVVAAAAAQARVTLHVVQLNGAPQLMDVERRSPNDTAVRDAEVRANGLEQITLLTGGRLRVAIGDSTAQFGLVARELSGYYVLGFQAERSDRDGRPHQITVTLSRKGAEVRARRVFSLAEPTAVDTGDLAPTELVRRWLRDSNLATDLRVAVSTYTIRNPEDEPGAVRVLISSEIGRVSDREADMTVGYTIADANGRNAGGAMESATLKRAGEGAEGPLSYVVSAVLPPGRYTLRLAATDGARHSGSVLHPFEARLTETRDLRFSSLIVLDPNVAEAGKPRPSVLVTVDDTLACYLEVYWPASSPAASLVGRLELISGADRPTTASVAMVLQPREPGRATFVGSLPVDSVPPGDYSARVTVSDDGRDVARIARVVTVAHAAGGGRIQLQEPRDVVPLPGPVVQGALTVGQVLERAGRYVVRYGEEMSVVIGIERYSQWMQNDDFLRPVTRVLVSEFALVRVKDDWLGFRDVYEVEGKPVADRKDRLLTLMRQSSAGALDEWRRITNESARYNLGAIQRNFNVPTMALFFLRPTNLERFRFTKDGEDRIEARVGWRLRYRETKRPTIVKTSQGKDMPVEGTVWIDPADGRVLKTRMEISAESRLGGQGDLTSKPDGFGDVVSRPTPGQPRSGLEGERSVRSSASVTVTYRHEPRLRLLVPAEMLEEYQGPATSRFSGRDTVTRIRCQATYSDFKRFETNGRMVVPK